MSSIHLRPFEEGDIPIYLQWAKQPHVASTWFLPGYLPPEEIWDKLGKPYDYPFVILLGSEPIGYVQASDLAAYRTLDPKACGPLMNEPVGTFCLDIFIGEADRLGQGYGSAAIRQLVTLLLSWDQVTRIVVDPSAHNARAIAFWTGLGFSFVRSAHGVQGEVCILEYADEGPKDL